MLSAALVLTILLLLLALVVIVIMNWEAARQHHGLIVAMGGVGVLCAIILAARAPAADPWPAWTQRIDSAIAACGEAADAPCLARAIAANPAPPSANETISQRFLGDLRIAEGLLASERARNLLWDEFGIDSNDFIGTGYSTPWRDDQAQRTYREARQREFFVANLCADIVDTTRCPTEAPNVWTWQLTGQDAQAWLSRPVSALITGVPPSDHVREWRAALPTIRDGGDDVRPVLIRFSRFNPQYYAGTVGRPSADFVFFAAIDDVGPRTLGEALALTGSAALADQAEDEILFIWLYAPSEGDVPTPATWGAVFDHLRTISATEPAAAEPTAP